MNFARKKDVIHDEILHRLITGRYRFGDVISVRELSEICGASRQPVMTALASLAADGFVAITAQVGCAVASPSTQEIGDYFLMFGRFEGLLAELAALRHSPRQLRELESLNDRIAALDLAGSEAGELYRLLNRDFHAIIHDMAQSPVLRQRQSALFNMADFYIVQTCGFAQYMANAAAEHSEIIAALRRNDAPAAMRAAEAHIYQIRDAILRNVPEAVIPARVEMDTSASPPAAGSFAPSTPDRRAAGVTRAARHKPCAAQRE